MIVERIWTANAYRNFNYLVACPETGEALAIDQLDHEKRLPPHASRAGRSPQVLNTHEHHDHTGGNAAVIAATGAKLLAHHRVGGRIAGVDRGVQAGDVIKVGKTCELECLDAPGHTLCHSCLLSHSEQPALFSGDTLFNAGAGNRAQWRRCQRAVQHVCRPASPAAGHHADLSRPRLHRKQTALHALPGTRQCRRQGVTAPRGRSGPGNVSRQRAGAGKKRSTPTCARTASA